MQILGLHNHGKKGALNRKLAAEMLFLENCENIVEREELSFKNSNNGKYRDVSPKVVKKRTGLSMKDNYYIWDVVCREDICQMMIW